MLPISLLFGPLFALRAAVSCAVVTRRPAPRPAPGPPPLPAPALPFDPRWRTEDTLGLARGIYEERAFDRLPLLADALMDAGCADERVLGCCRGERRLPGKCWVVQAILGET